MVNKFIYPRTVTVLRPNSQIAPAGGAGTGVPSQPGSSGTYWGASRVAQTTASGAGEALVRSAVPCSIQGMSGKATNSSDLPADAPGPSRWHIFMPLASCPKGTIKVRDVLVDDEGLRYQVSAPYWNSLGYRVEAVLEEM